MPTVSETANDTVTMQLDSRGVRVLDAIDRMSFDRAFYSTFQFVREDSEVLVPAGNGELDYVDLAGTQIGYAPTWLHNFQESYNRSVQTYLTRTAGQEFELVNYMQWFMARRDVTLSTLSLQMNPMAATAFVSNWGYQQFPWPWQFADQAAIAAYVGQGSLDFTPAAAPSNLTSVLTPPTPISIATATQAVNSGPIFAPTQLEAIPGDDVNITVSLPRTTFDGGFVLTVTLPVGIELVNIPKCKPLAACEGAALQTEIAQSQGGSTSVRVSGMLIDREYPAHFRFHLKLTDQIPAGDSLLVTAELGFMSSAVPPNMPTKSELEISA